MLTNTQKITSLHTSEMTAVRTGLYSSQRSAELEKPVGDLRAATCLRRVGLLARCETPTGFFNLHNRTNTVGGHTMSDHTALPNFTQQCNAEDQRLLTVLRQLDPDYVPELTAIFRQIPDNATDDVKMNQAEEMLSRWVASRCSCSACRTGQPELCFHKKEV